MSAFHTERLATRSSRGSPGSVGALIEEPTVIVIDHDAAVRDALSISLHIRGFQVLAFRKAGDFLETCPVERHACLLVEYDLEDMKGTDLVKHMIDRYINMPAIIMSARLRKPPVDDPLPQGIAGFLPKPFGQDEIVWQLKLAFGHPH